MEVEQHAANSAGRGGDKCKFRKEIWEKQACARFCVIYCLNLISASLLFPLFARAKREKGNNENESGLFCNIYGELKEEEFWLFFSGKRRKVEGSVGCNKSQFFESGYYQKRKCYAGSQPLSVGRWVAACTTP